MSRTVIDIPTVPTQEEIVSIDLTSEVAGVLPIANGGTNASTVSAARTSLGLGTAATKDTGTSASQVVLLDGSAKIPAVDGSQITNIVGLGTYASRPAAGTAGRIYISTDGYTIDRDTGSVWASYGLLQRIVVPSSSYTWNWLTQNSATDTTFGPGYIKLKTIASQTTFSTRYKTIPSNPFVITVLLDTLKVNATSTGSGAAAGLFLGVNAGNHIFFGWDFSGSEHVVGVYRMNSSFAFSSSTITAEIPYGRIYFQIEHDANGNRYYRYGYDGVNFAVIASEANTAYITPDRVGYCANSGNMASDGSSLIIYSWEET